MLTAWLRGPCPSKAEHGRADAKVFSHEDRVAARQHFATLPGAALLLAVEGPMRSDEAEGEPLANP